MVRGRSLAEPNLFSIQIKRNQGLSQNGPLDFDDAANKKVPAQGAAAGNVTGKQGRDKLDSFWVCFFKLDDVSNETIERLYGVLVEQGVEVLRELSPVLRCPSVSGRYQSSIEAMERGRELTQNLGG
jgi:hypothetical protein